MNLSKSVDVVLMFVKKLRNNSNPHDSEAALEAYFQSSDVINESLLLEFSEVQ